MKPPISNQLCRSVSARTMTRGVVLASLVFAVIAFAGTTETKAQDKGYIKEYKNNVFTNKGQGSVQEFEAKLNKAEDALKDITLDVYVGYHADKNGQWCDITDNFDKAEKGDVSQMKIKFPSANLIWLKGPNKLLTDAQIKDAVSKGNVFFTWCDSDTRVNDVLKGSMPTFVKQFD